MNSRRGGASEGPAAFRQALSDAIAKCLEEDRKAGNINRGFIFFIDDLDRLDPPVAVQILELLKNLFEVENCIFILAIDYDVVVKGLEPKFGPMTEKNEREFRSFFDKIIQLPFSMPVSAYNIDSYLAKSLAEIGYFTPEELAGAYGNGTLVEKTAEMALLSTGSNPRSVKRLINSLSLIRIMHEMAAENAPMSATEKLVNFGFVCIQIAYPAVYDMLLYEPNFKNWNERVAKRFRVAALNDDTRESLGGMEEFDEEWEQVLYRACQSNSYLAARAYSVSRLLNLIASLLASSEDFGEEIERILSFAAVTTVTSAENAAPKTGGRVRLQSLDDFLAEQRTRGVKEELLPVIKGIAEQCAAVFGDFVRLEFAPGGLMAQVVNNKSRERRLVAVYPRKNSLLVQTGDYTANGVRSLDAAKEDGLPADFFDKARKVFKKISLDRLPKEAE